MAVVGLYRVMCVLQGDSNLPRDRFVNVFHAVHKLGNDDPTQADWDELHIRVSNVYLGLGDQTVQVSALLGSHLSATNNAHQTRAYRMSDPAPRPPNISTFTAAGDPGSPPLPAEVAVACSYYADSNSPGRRGRIYFGPLSNAVNENLPSEPRVKASARADFTIALERLFAGNLDPNTSFNFGLYKPALPERLTKAGATLPARDDDFLIPTHVWCDDAYDTQRRRGLKPTTRTVRVVD